MATPLRILFIPSPVGPLGSGQGGGVETNIINLAPVLAKRGHTIGVLTAKGSITLSGVTMYEVSGELPSYAMHAKRSDAPIVQAHGLLENLWEKAREIANEYDLIVGINYDWLAYYLTPFFPIPVCHIISISSTIAAVDEMIYKRYAQYPNHFAVNTTSQAKTFSFLDSKGIVKLYGGVPIHIYSFQSVAKKRLVWAGRISSEKNLQDVFMTARLLHLPLDICGKIQNESYWQNLTQKFSDVRLTYHGFLSQHELQRVFGNAGVFLMTSKPPYIEAFGTVCVEAMSCGTPVVAYGGGGPDEILEEGKSGYVVSDGTVSSFAEKVKAAFLLDRSAVRLRAEEFSIEKMADRYLSWFASIIQLPYLPVDIEQ